MIYKRLIRAILFCLDAEKAHYFATQMLCLVLKIPLVRMCIKRYYQKNNQLNSITLFGLTFPNPIGLAAGFDKDAKMIEPLSVLGFGFVEIGTVTPKPQEGNPKPRLFRLKEEEALINRMGFNNQGLAAVLERLKKRKSKVIVGANIGKNKTTPNELAIRDYLQCFNTLFKYVDYFTINVSSPNTPDLRALQNKDPLTKLLQTLQEHNRRHTRIKPVFLKIAPDLNNRQLDDIIEIALTTKIQGIIATNTTTERNQLKTQKKILNRIGAGGLSGRPLAKKSTEMIRHIYTKSKGKLKVIGVGGIHSPEDAIEKLRAGACLIQLYTGFIYEGPELVTKVNRAIYDIKNTTT